MSEMPSPQQAEHSTHDTEQLITAIQQGGQLSEADRWGAIGLYDRIAISPDDSEATIVTSEGDTEAFKDIETAKKIREIHNAAHAATQGLEKMAQEELKGLSEDESFGARIPVSLHFLSSDLDIGSTTATYTDYSTGIANPFDHETAVSVRRADLLDSMDRTLDMSFGGEGTYSKESKESANSLYKLIAIDGENATIQIADGISAPIDVEKARKIKEIAEQSPGRIQDRAQAYFANLEHELGKSNDTTVDDAREAVAAAHRETPSEDSLVAPEISGEQPRILVGVGGKTREALSRLGHEDRGTISFGGEQLTPDEVKVASIKRMLKTIATAVEAKDVSIHTFGGTQAALLKGFKEMMREDAIDYADTIPHPGPEPKRSDYDSSPSFDAVFTAAWGAHLNAKDRYMSARREVFLYGGFGSDRPDEEGAPGSISDSELALDFQEVVSPWIAEVEASGDMTYINELCDKAKKAQVEQVLKAYPHLKRLGTAEQAVEVEKRRVPLDWEDQSKFRQKSFKVIDKPRRTIVAKGRSAEKRREDPHGTAITGPRGGKIKSERLRRVLWKLGFGQH